MIVIQKIDDDSDTEIGETKKRFNNLRNNFSREGIKEHRENFIKKNGFIII